MVRVTGVEPEKVWALRKQSCGLFLAAKSEAGTVAKQRSPRTQPAQQVYPLLSAKKVTVPIWVPLFFARDSKPEGARAVVKRYGLPFYRGVVRRRVPKGKAFGSASKASAKRLHPFLSAKKKRHPRSGCFFLFLVFGRKGFEACLVDSFK